MYCTVAVTTRYSYDRPALLVGAVPYTHKERSAANSLGPCYSLYPFIRWVRSKSSLQSGKIRWAPTEFVGPEVVRKLPINMFLNQLLSIGPAVVSTSNRAQDLVQHDRDAHKTVTDERRRAPDKERLYLTSSSVPPRTRDSFTRDFHRQTHVNGLVHSRRMILRPQPPPERGGTGTLFESVNLCVRGGACHDSYQVGDIPVGVFSAIEKPRARGWELGWWEWQRRSWDPSRTALHKD